MVYFIGIGGIGMSALARYFNLSGKRVYGYDLTPTKLTERLIEEGIDITFRDDAEEIPGHFKKKSNKDGILVVYTPAIPSDNKIFRYFLNNGYHMVKRSAILGELVNKAKGIAVAGTHGKTSVSALTAHLLTGSSAGCTGFLGGVAKNYKSNLLVNSDSELVVVEADEYDRSFLRLFPYIAVITSMDPDHLDIYGNFEELKKAFSGFAGQVKDGGTLICRQGIDLVNKHGEGVDFYTYGLDDTADFYASDIKIGADGLSVFNFVAPGIQFSNIKLGIPGRFNVENAVAAIAVAMICGVGETAIRRGLESFRGILRRFEIKINTRECVMIDDYAHHPAELKACISAVREIFPGRKITGIFQPHLYSRTRDFADQFAESLEELDSLVLLDIYPARERPIPGVSSEIIFRKVKLKGKVLCTRKELTGIIEGMQTDIVITLGAGNIDTMVEPVKKVLLKKTEQTL
ncbi:MAG: UDP-N-acetylmuramate--L-alanine ligase [Bacteroidales bacterium]